MDYAPTPDEFNLAILLLRLVIGPVIAFHGYAKIFRGGGLEGTAGWFESIGMRPGDLCARLAAGGELLTGVCFTLGLLTPFAGLGIVGLMGVAFWAVHRGNGLLITAGGWEYVLVVGAIGVTLAMLGPGRWSLDNVLGLDLNGGAGLAISLVGGLAAAAAFLAATFKPVPAASQSAEAADA